MVELIKRDGRLDLLLPGVTLKGARVTACAEDWGEIELTPGEIVPGEHEVSVQVTHEEYNLSGQMTLREENGLVTLWVDVGSKVGTFSAWCSFAGKKSLNLIVSEIEDTRALLAMHLFCPWWTRPAFPKALRDVPEKTQMMLSQTDHGCAFLLPMTADRFKTDLCGCEEGLRISANANEYGYARLTGPLLAVTADRDPFRAVEIAYTRCAASGLIRTPLKKGKRYPEMMNYLGWCSWNAFYADVNAKGLEDKLAELKEKHVPVRWILIDDGWSQTRDGMLVSFEEDKVKFPEGLKGFIRKAHEQYGIGEVGVWHAFDGYWNGIDPEGELAQSMKHALSPTKSGWLVPGFTYEQSFAFYNAWHSWLRAQGVDYLKVDNQSSCINYTRNSAPVSSIFSTHDALEDSVARNFSAPLINCMGMANESAFHRKASVVTRNSDDFFPNREGSFVSHIMQNAYNSIFTDPLYVADYDMWWTSHPSAVVSSVLRAISGGPVYVSDKVGETDPAMLRPLIEEDGRLIRCDHAAKPAPSCLFEDVPNGSGVLKLTNRCGENPVTAAFNLTDGQKTCVIRPEDTECMPGTKYLAHLFFENRDVAFDAPIELTLDAGKAEVISFYPIRGGKALVGDPEKYIGAGSRKTHVVTL